MSLPPGGGHIERLGHVSVSQVHYRCQAMIHVGCREETVDITLLSPTPTVSPVIRLGISSTGEDDVGSHFVEAHFAP